jgi:hypothetical protein
MCRHKEGGSCSRRRRVDGADEDQGTVGLRGGTEVWWRVRGGVSEVWMVEHLERGGGSETEICDVERSSMTWV